MPLLVYHLAGSYIFSSENKSLFHFFPRNGLLILLLLSILMVSLMDFWRTVIGNPIFIDTYVK